MWEIPFKKGDHAPKCSGSKSIAWDTGMKVIRKDSWREGRVRECGERAGRKDGWENKRELCTPCTEVGIFISCTARSHWYLFCWGVEYQSRAPQDCKCSIGSGDRNTVSGLESGNMGKNSVHPLISCVTLCQSTTLSDLYFSLLIYTVCKMELLKKEQPQQPQNLHWSLLPVEHQARPSLCNV